MKIVQDGEGVGEVVSLSTAKQHCRVRHNDDDTIIQHYLDAATDWVQTACQSVFLETPFRAEGPDFRLDLTKYPNAVIQSVGYVDLVGATGEITDFSIVDGWLRVENQPEVSAVTVIFKAGLGAGNVPAKLVQAVLMLTASFYLQRADLSSENMDNVPMGVRAMVIQHRSFAFA